MIAPGIGHVAQVAAASFAPDAGLADDGADSARHVADCPRAPHGPGVFFLTLTRTPSV